MSEIIQTEADKALAILSSAKLAFEDFVAKTEKKVEDIEAAITNLAHISTPSLVRALEAELVAAKAELTKLKL